MFAGRIPRFPRVIGTIRAVTVAVEDQAMIGQFKTEPLGNVLLPPFNFFIAEFLNPPAIQTENMIMMGAPIQLKHRLAVFKVITFDQPGCFKLGQRPIHRRQPDVLAGIAQRLKNGLNG
jgi:hypothetical protein